MQKTETKSVTGKVMKELTEKVAKLIDRIRLIPYGRITVIMENGRPIRTEKGIQSEKL
jgi:hypothetical protein